MNVPDHLMKELLELLDINGRMLVIHGETIASRTVLDHRKKLQEVKHKIEEAAKEESNVNKEVQEAAERLFQEVKVPDGDRFNQGVKLRHLNNAILQFQDVYIANPADNNVDKFKEMLGKIVCTEGIDMGVVLLNNDGPTHFEKTMTTEGERTVQVYDHMYFSPLGDALIELWEEMNKL